MDENTKTNGHIDYREAFVIDMEMAAHGPSCQRCMRTVLKGEEDFCDRMQFMRSYIKRAYEALPTYYKNRYENATRDAISYANLAVRDIGGLG